MDSINKKVIEIRFKPYPPILDKLGRTVFKLLNENEIHWEINGQRNRFDVWNEDKSFTFFSTYFSFGALFEDDKYFEEFIKLSKTYLEEFPNLIFTRFGYRSSSLTKSEIVFDDLKQKFKVDLFAENSVKYIPGDTELKDYAFSVLLKHSNNLLNISAGPMEEDQSKNVFNKEATYDVGLFLDLDYYNKDNLPSTQKLKNLKEFLNDSKSEVSKVEELFIKNMLLSSESSNDDKE